jgi:sugar lactone lactonase YvrE
MSYLVTTFYRNTVEFANITGLAYYDGYVYAVDRYRSVILRISPQGEETILAGYPRLIGHADGVGSKARFRYPIDIAVNTEGQFFITDEHNQCIRQMDIHGNVRTLTGIPRQQLHRDGSLADARFANPRGIAIGQDGSIYVADTVNFVIRRVDTRVTTLAGAPYEHGYVDDVGEHARFNGMFNIATGHHGNVYVTERQRIRCVQPNGQVTTIPVMRDALQQFRGIVADPFSDNVYVVDHAYNVVLNVQPNGLFTIVAGREDLHTGNANGQGHDARFNHPEAITMDPMGNLYVADWNGIKMIRNISPTRENRARKQAALLELTHMPPVASFPGGTNFLRARNSFANLTRRRKTRRNHKKRKEPSDHTNRFQYQRL